MTKKKKSVFVKELKKFKSSFTGEEVEYKINNALWAFMERDFELTQNEWAEKFDGSKAYYGSIFATCLLNANGYESTLDDVLMNTDAEDISTLTLEYIQSLYEEAGGLEAITGNKDNNNEEDKERPS